MASTDKVTPFTNSANSITIINENNIENRLAIVANTILSLSIEKDVLFLIISFVIFILIGI
jgi:hypothetical protein